VIFTHADKARCVSPAAGRGRPRLHLAPIGALTLAIAALAGAPTATPLGSLSVQVPAHPSVAGHVHISFRPHSRLPRGGYYYAVAVLVGYASASLTAPPSCATSSDMRETEYGYPHPDSPVHLTLLPAKSADGHWCPGGTYEGAIYAVPHGPPCTSSYPCYGKSTLNGACWEFEGHVACGVVAKPEPEPKPKPPEPEPKPPNPQPGPPGPSPPPPYSYPGGLPKPVDHSARLVGRFKLGF
jgi:hypothetical protein